MTDDLDKYLGQGDLIARLGFKDFQGIDVMNCWESMYRPDDQ